MIIKYNIKSVSKRRNRIQTKELEIENKPNTIEELIKEVVVSCVKNFNEKCDNKELLKVFSKDEIEDMAETGKVSFGYIYGEKKEDIEKAIERAKLAFEDGIVAIFIDDEKYEKLDNKINLTENSVVTFIKLTFLCGRMW